MPTNTDINVTLLKSRYNPNYEQYNMNVCQLHRANQFTMIIYKYSHKCAVKCMLYNESIYKFLNSNYNLFLNVITIGSLFECFENHDK